LQRAVSGAERAAYEKLIAPFVNDMPKSEREGYRRVCGERKYAFVVTEFFRKLESIQLSCEILPLPGTSYPGKMSYIISKTSHYKGLINWR
jgi:hypothetical protein